MTRGRQRWGGVALVLGWLALSWVPLSRIGLSDDEANPAYLAYSWLQSGRPGWMISPYTGSAKAIIFFCLQKFLPPSVVMVRLVALGLGAALGLAIYALAEEYAGAMAAWAAAAFTLTAPSYFILARYDITCGTIGLIFLVGAAFAFLRWWRSGASWLACAAAGLCGLAVWDHIILAEPVCAAAAALVLLRRRELARRLTGRPGLAPAAAGSFLLGLWPLLAHLYPASLEATRRSAAEGRDWWRVALDNGRAVAGSLSGLSDRSIVLGGAADPGRSAAWIVLAGLALTLVWLGLDRAWRRRLALPWAQTAFCAAAALSMTPLVPHHVPLIFCPWLALTLGVSCAGLWEGRKRPGLRLALALPAAACLVISSADLGGLSAAIRAGRVDPWQAGENLDELSAFLKTRTEQVEPLDFNLLHNIPVLANGAVRVDPAASDLFWRIADGRMPEPPRTFVGPGRLFVLHPPCGMHFPGARLALWRSAQADGWRMRLVRRIGSGPRAIEIYDMVRGRMPVGEPEAQIPENPGSSCGDWDFGLSARQ